MNQKRPGGATENAYTETDQQVDAEASKITKQIKLAPGLPIPEVILTDMHNTIRKILLEDRVDAQSWLEKTMGGKDLQRLLELQKRPINMISESEAVELHKLMKRRDVELDRLDRQRKLSRGEIVASRLNKKLWNPDIFKFWGWTENACIVGGTLASAAFGYMIASPRFLKNNMFWACSGVGFIGSTCLAVQRASFAAEGLKFEMKRDVLGRQILQSYRELQRITSLSPAEAAAEWKLRQRKPIDPADFPYYKPPPWPKIDQTGRIIPSDDV